MNRTEHARVCFLRACELDVAVRKPGNVSLASPGHGMQAAMFSASAQAAAGPLFEAGARVGERIEASVAATWAAAGCNTNLGILLLCAPIAMAVESRPEAAGPAALQAAVEAVLADLDVTDAAAAYRAIARANPGGLGSAPSQDVQRPPSIALRAAMTLAAPRDSIARQYRDGFVDLFELGLPALGEGFSLLSDAGAVAAVQRLYLLLLSRFADSHIVRNRGAAVAHIVMSAAQAWTVRAAQARALEADAGLGADFVAWDESLKSARINPGTTADLTVATLLIAGLSAPA